MYKISDTENCYELFVYDDELEDGTKVIVLASGNEDDTEIGLDKEQAEKLIKKLEEFINEHH